MSNCKPSPLLSKNDEKFIRSLSLKKFRDLEGLFIVEGEKMVEEALSSTLDVVKLFRTADIGEDAMKRISLLSTPSPALAVVHKPVSAGFSGHIPEGIAIALDSVRDPGNLGTIIRLCDWFGIEAIFASPDTVDTYNPKTVQASMGAILREQVVYTDLCTIAEEYRKAGIPVCGTFLDGDDIRTQTLDRKHSLIIMGSESFGISKELSEKVTQRLFIPPFPSDAHTSESLNVAIATAILCYEFRK